MCVYVREKQSQTLREKNLFLKFLFIYLFLAVLGLPCCVGLSVAVTSGCCSLVVILWRLIVKQIYLRGQLMPMLLVFFFPILISEVLDIQDEEVSMAGKGSQHCPIILHSPMVIFPFFP